MDFAKFFLVAIFLDLFIFAVATSFYAEMGSDANPFVATQKDINTLLNPSTGEVNDTWSGVDPGSSAATGETSSANTLVNLFSFTSKLFSQIQAGLGILWTFLSAPVQLANVVYTEMSSVGGADLGVKLLINGFAVFWIVGEVIGFIQFFRGGKF